MSKGKRTSNKNKGKPRSDLLRMWEKYSKWISTGILSGVLGILGGVFQLGRMYEASIQNKEQAKELKGQADAMKERDEKALEMGGMILDLKDQVNDLKEQLRKCKDEGRKDSTERGRGSE